MLCNYVDEDYTSSTVHLNNIYCSQLKSGYNDPYAQAAYNVSPPTHLPNIKIRPQGTVVHMFKLRNLFRSSECESSGAITLSGVGLKNKFRNWASRYQDNKLANTQVRKLAVDKLTVARVGIGRRGKELPNAYHCCNNTEFMAPDGIHWSCTIGGLENVGVISGTWAVCYSSFPMVYLSDRLNMAKLSIPSWLWHRLWYLWHQRSS